MILQLLLCFVTFAESLLVLTSCGLQVKTTYLIGRSATQFLDIAQVKDIVINEGIRMVRQYLTSKQCFQEKAFKFIHVLV